MTRRATELISVAISSLYRPGPENSNVPSMRAIAASVALSQWLHVGVTRVSSSLTSAVNDMDAGFLGFRSESNAQYTANHLQNGTIAEPDRMISLLIRPNCHCYPEISNERNKQVMFAHLCFVQSIRCGGRTREGHHASQCGKAAIVALCNLFGMGPQPQRNNRQHGVTVQQRGSMAHYHYSLVRTFTISAARRSTSRSLAKRGCVRERRKTVRNALRSAIGSCQVGRSGSTRSRTITTVPRD